MKRSTWARIIFAAALILIIIYTFWGSWQDIVNRILNTAPLILILIATWTVIYHLIEAWITLSLARIYNPDLRYYQAIYCAFYASFYRLSTLGTGSGVAAIVYLGGHGLEYYEATGMYMFQYTLHKVSIAAFSGIFFLINWTAMVSSYRRYGVYLILAYILTIVIVVFFILLIVFPPFHRVVMWFLEKFNRRHRFDNLVDRVRKELDAMEKTAPDLLKNGRIIVATILKNFLKLCFWYSIPFLVLFQDRVVSLRMSLGVTSLAVTTAAVIPTPAGIGSSELIMSGLYSVLIGVQEAAAVTLLYRIATFFLPFGIGALLILIKHIATREKKPDQTKGAETANQ